MFVFFCRLCRHRRAFCHIWLMIRSRCPVPGVRLRVYLDINAVSLQIGLESSDPRRCSRLMALPRATTTFCLLLLFCKR